MPFQGFPTTVLTDQADTATAAQPDELVFGAAGNDTLSAGGQSAFLLGGSGDDTYRPDYIGFTIINDLSGSGDTLVDPATAPGVASDYRIFRVLDTNIADDIRSHIAIANPAGQGLLIVDAGGVSGDLDNVVVGEVLSVILNGAHPIGSVITFDQFLIDSGAKIGSPANPFFAGIAFMNSVFGAVDGPILSQLFDDINSAAGDIEAFGGGPGDDLVIGDSFSNYLVGGAGADTINGLAGNDEIDADAGDDEIDAGLGDDTVFGGADNDTFVAGSGAFDGNDVFEGGDGIDTYSAAASIEDLVIDLDFQIAFGGKIGTDVLIDVENATGGSGNDLIVGTVAANLLTGNDGNDTLIGGGDGDTLDGGGGTDIASYAFSSGLVVAYRDAPSLNFGDAAGDSYISIEGLEGSAHNDFLFGSNVTGDILRGLAGIDQIFGFGGNDTIDGGADFDYILGGEGDDSIDGGAGLDILSGDNGDDTINGGDQFDQIFGGAGDDSLSGDGDSDFLFGGADNDTLNGGDGTDFLFGESGADDLRGDGAYDLLQGGDGNDTLFGGDDGASIVNGLIGQGGDDRLIGGTGIDYMTGGDGAVDTGNDTFVFTVGGNIDVVLDFQAGAGLGDVIEIDSAATGISSFAQLQAEARLFDIGSYAGIIITAGADVVYLLNVAVADLASDDFAFV